MRRPVLLAACLLGATAALRADDRAVLSGESRAVTGKIDDIRQRLDAKKWDAALAMIQSLTETSGDDLALVGPDRAVQARVVCQRLLIGLPTDVRPEVLRLYRGRAETQARKWLEQGLAGRDVRLLRRIVDEAFCTRAAEKALDALGDLAFERGRFDEAELWWRTLTPLTEPGRGDLFFPDPETTAARTRAKQLLARLFRGDPRFADDLAGYRKQYPDAAGRFAGRAGRYADTLKALADAAGEPLTPRDWPTFGGGPGRGPLLPATARVTDRLGALCRRPTWRFDLANRERLDDVPPPVQWDGNDRKSARSMAFFPVVVGDKVIVADARTVTAFDIHTGRGEEWFDANRVRPDFTLNLSLPAPADLRYSLTVADDCVVARLGTQELRDAKQDGEADSLLACLNLDPGPGEQRLRWQVRAATRADGIFEGAPVVQDGQVFVAVTRCTPDKTVTAVRCYALEARGTPPPRWSRDVCETREFQVGDRRRRHHLLTVAGPNVVYCSHSGAIVALDARTGRHAWAVRYRSSGVGTDGAAAPDGPRLPGIDRPALRDVTPCLFAEGSVFAAPADSDRLLCLDPLTGRTRWDRKVVEVVHLLGVGRGRLIFTTGSALRAVDAATGADAWIAPDAGELPPMGRGLLLGDLVLWPTPRGVLMVRQDDGRLAEDPGFLHSVPKGNLAFGRGCLVVTDRHTLAVFAPPALHLRERRNEAEEKPESAEAALELGLAEADAGQFDAAVRCLERAERLAPRGATLRDEARAARHGVYLTAAQRAADAGKRAEADGALGKAAGPEYSPELRVRAQRLQAEQRERFGDFVGAVNAWQRLLEDEQLRGVRVAGDNGLPATAGQLATDRIAALLRKHGATVYREVERRAKARFDAAPTGKDRAAALERLTVDFPNAAARRVALRELIALYSQSGRPAALGHTYGRLIADPGPEDDLEKLRSDSFLAAVRYPLARSTFPVRLPLFRSWETSLDSCEAVLVGAGWIDYEAEHFLFSSLKALGPSTGGSLYCRRVRTGEWVWQTSLAFVPEWFAAQFPLILLGGRSGVAAVRCDDGHLVWSFPAAASHFQRTGGHLLFLDQGRLLAMDADSGRVLWQREAPGRGFLPELGRFHCNYYARAGRVLIQTATGRRWLLDAETGATIADVPTTPKPWPAVPHWLPHANRILLTTDTSRVVAIDSQTGAEGWTFAVNAPSTIAGRPPQILVGTNSVLVLTQTNLGQRLQRLDAATGKPIWPKMPFLDPLTPDQSEWAIDEDTVYLPQGNKLVALSLADGKPRWETALTGPAASWRAVREGSFLLAYPAKVPEWRFQFRSPLGAVQWGVSLPPEERPGAGCPLLALDPATGRLVQRWSFPAGSIRLRSYPAEKAFWPAVGVEHGSGAAGLTVTSTRGGLVVALDGQAWGMKTKE